MQSKLKPNIMPNRPSSIAEAIEQVCQPHREQVLSRHTIVKWVIDLMGCKPSSVMPSDYCYNRTNAGIATQQPMFVMLDRASYRFIGRGARYTGPCFRLPRSAAPIVVGEWINGEWKPRFVAAGESSAPAVRTMPAKRKISAPKELRRLPLSLDQIERLYERYREILLLEASDFGCSPTELKHLIGRLGELYAARRVRGTLATQTNQHGFDVIGPGAQRISVKTTAQDPATFVPFNPRTLDQVDAVMILHFRNWEFEVTYEGPIEPLRPHFQAYGNRLELTLTKAEEVAKTLQAGGTNGIGG